MQEQMCTISREMEIPVKIQKQILEIRSTVIKILNAFDGFIGRLGKAEARNQCV